MKLYIDNEIGKGIMDLLFFTPGDEFGYFIDRETCDVLRFTIGYLKTNSKFIKEL